jgi:tRNA (guanine-N7-)-methyltransferase
MQNELPARAWTNPFILKLQNHQDTIFNLNSIEKIDQLKATLTEKFAAWPSIILEICSGSGTHALSLAQTFPQSLIVGIELRYKRIVRTAEKARVKNITNICLLHIDANYIDQVFDPNSVDQVYMNFPDPWDGKARWDDRFLLSKDYLNKIFNMLKPGCSFAFKTDHSRRFMQVAAEFETLPAFGLTEYSEDLHTSIYQKQNISTEFERLFTNQKKPVFYLKAIKAKDLNTLSTDL